MITNMALFERLNQLASKLSNNTDNDNSSFFNQKFFDEPETGISTLMDKFKALDSASQKRDYVYELLEEALSLLNRKPENKPESLNLDAIGKVIVLLCDHDRFNFDIFVSLVNSFPWEPENGLYDLLGCMKELQTDLCVYLNDSFLSKGPEKWSKDFWSSFKKAIVPEFFLLQKPNVFLECSTGFSQLILMLSIAFENVDRFQSVQYYNKQLKFIMGKYRLDPIRCLDLILQVCSLHVVEHHEFILELLRLTEFWPHSNLANCQEYEHLNQGGNPVATRLIINHLNTQSSDEKYIDLVVQLIKGGFVSFAAIFDCLTPGDSTIEEFVSLKLKKLEEESLEGSLNPLAMAAVLPDDDDDKDDSKGNEDTKASDLKDAEMSEKEREALLSDSVETSPKWKLVERLLTHSMLMPGLYALLKYPKFFNVNDKLVECVLQVFDDMIQPLLRSLNKMDISQSFRPISKLSHNGIPTKQDRLVRQYNSLQKTPSFIQGAQYIFYSQDTRENILKIETIQELFDYSHLLFDIIGPRILLNPKLVEHICAIIESDISNNSQNENNLEKWINYTRKFLVPVLGLIEDQQIVANAIYSVMKHFPYEKRYFLYNELNTKTSEDNIHVRLQFNKYQKKIRSLLKSLSIDNIAVKCRDVANYVSCNPLSTLGSILKQIENYDKVSELIVVSAEFFSDFAYDTLQYILLIQLASERSTLQDDGITPKMWISRLSLFIAGLAKVCSKMDMSNIFVFMVKSLHKDPSLTLSILKEMITQVAGIQNLYDVNWNTLIMLNSGPFLKQLGRALVLDFRDKYFNRSKAIINYLVKLNAVSEMIVMLTNLNLKIQSENDVHFKILSSKCDESNSLLWSFIELLKHVLTEEQFKANVLPFNVLIEDYQFPVEWAFDIWRDYFDSKLMRSEEDASQINNILYDTNFNSIEFNNLEKTLLIDFWRLSLYDIRLDEKLYKEQHDLFEGKRRNAKVLKERHSLLNDVQKISNDLSEHRNVLVKTKKLLEENKALWFPVMSSERIAAFLQHCVIPRVIFSPFDAIYSATFITETFSKQEVLDIVKQLVSSGILGTLLFSLTVNESSNMALFFKDIFVKVEEWRHLALFDDNELTKQQLCEVYYELTEQVSFALEESNYMSIRNTIQFLNFISEVFPVVDEHLQLVLETLDDLLEREKREDIILPCNALKGHLKARLATASKKSDFVTLPESEVKKYQEELALIKKYRDAKKAEELEEKRKEEAEQRERENAERKSSDNTRSTSSHSKTNGNRAIPISQVMDGLYKVERHIKDVDYSRAVPFIYDLQSQSDFRKLIHNPNNINSFRNKLRILLEDYYEKVTNNPPEHYKSIFESILKSTQSAPLPQGPISSSMYEESDVKPTKGAASKYSSDKSRTATSTRIPNEPKNANQTPSNTNSRATPATAASTTPASRYQRSSGPVNLPKAPAGASKPATTQSRFHNALPSGPRNDNSYNNRNSNNPKSSSAASQPPARSYGNHNQGKSFGNIPNEPRKRQSEESYQGSSRFSNSKRPKLNERDRDHDRDRSSKVQNSLPTGPKRQAGGSRFSR